MANSFWLQDEDANTFILDSNVQELSISGYQRDYKVIDYAGSPGGQIRGFGVPGSRILSVSRKEKKENGDMNFWNSRRDAILLWINKARYISVWLYIRNGEDNRTIRSRTYPQKVGSDKIKNIAITDSKDFELLLPDGVFENITATTVNETIISSATQDKAITNAGTWEAPGKFKFTPTGNETLFQVTLGDQFGFRLEGNFLAGNQIVYDTYDNSLTIAGSIEVLSQYLTNGSVFNIPAGSSTLNITCSGAGSFQLEYNERYV